jgi:SAM-dependent methyltransferase
MADDISKFITAIGKSLADETFVKLTLGNYKGAEEQLQKILIRRIVTKKGDRLDFTYRYKTRDVAKNYALDDSLNVLRKLVGRDFHSGNLFTSENDIQLEVKKKATHLSVTKASFSSKPATEHDREKNYLVDPRSRYLHELGITSSKGEILGKQRDKWTQINKFVEIVSGLIDESKLKNSKKLTIVDMGSGKGYLTFALYDHLKNTRGLDTKITGVEVRTELVSLCNDVAKRCGFTGLNFVRNTIEGFEFENADVLIALHACDTATDDALFKGISSNAEIMIAAPCCHKEIRSQIRPPELLRGLLKHGTLIENEAESLTDGLRALLLEREGYKTKVFEFVGVEHTPKNNMIVGVRGARPNLKVADQIREIKAFYGIANQRLEWLLDR